MPCLPDGVYRSRFTKEKFLAIYEKTKGIRSMFPDVVDFIVWITRRDTLILETDEGIVVLYDMEPHLGCRMMAFFFDGKMSARTELVRGCLLWAFTTFDLARISVWVPSSYLAFIRWTREKLGFKEDGKLRAVALHEGHPINYTVLSLLCEEVL